MRITIVKKDNLCLVDGVAVKDMDFDSLPSDLHAIQWKDGEGEMEFLGEANVSFTSFDAYEYILQQFNIKLDERENPTGEKLFEITIQLKREELWVEMDNRRKLVVPTSKSRSKDKLLSRSIRLIRKESQGRATAENIAELDAMEALDQHLDLVADAYDSAESYLEESTRTQEELENYDVASDPSWPIMEG